MSGRQPTPGAAGVGGTSCWRVQPMSCIGSALTTATWRSGYATVCKTVYPGSIPGVASNSDPTIQKAQGRDCPVGSAGALTLGRVNRIPREALKTCYGGHAWNHCCYAISTDEIYIIPIYIGFQRRHRFERILP